MLVTFCGAVREVTGSMHLVSTETDRVLLDCGLHQGRRKEADEKNRVFPFDPRMITNVVLSHAHIDHSGRIPLLSRKGFAGSVLCTRATQDACNWLLPDSAHIQESDAQYLNYKLVRRQLALPRGEQQLGKRTLKKIRALLKKDKHRLNADAINELIEQHNLAGVRPLYTVPEAEAALTQFEGVPYGTPFEVGRNLTATLFDAGHILGSAMVFLRYTGNGRTFTLCFTGDVGRFDKPILEDPTLEFPEEYRDVDLMILESTYGDRVHEPARDMKGRLEEVVNETVDRGGVLLIPSFAFGRTQELVYFLHQLLDEKKIPAVPIFVDSPLATRMTTVFGEHPEVMDADTHADFLEKGENPFWFEKLRFIEEVSESMDLMRRNDPHIVLSASGMCEAGRILHHLRYKIHSAKNTILVVGYMAENTLGRRILDLGEAYEKSGRKGDAPVVKFLNKSYPLKAHVVSLGGFSAHADYNEMFKFLKESNLNVKRMAVVHGEEDQSLALAGRLEAAGFQAMVPRIGETVRLR